MSKYGVFSDQYFPAFGLNTERYECGKLRTKKDSVFGHFSRSVVSAIFFFKKNNFHQMKTLQKLWKMFLLSSKKLFSFSRHSNFCISIFPSFLSCQPFRIWSKINLEVYDVINCLNKNLITHFVWYLEKEKRNDTETLFTERVLNKGHFYGKSCKKCAPKAFPRPIFNLVNNPKQSLHARNSFENKIFWKMVIKNP